MEIILIVGALLGVIPAIIAAKKGRNFFGWWLFGAALFIVALPVAILINPSTESQKQCPDCRNWVAREATKCRHCGAEFRVGAAGSKPGVDYIDPGYASKEAIDSWNAAHAAAAEPANKECPRCAEAVRFKATVCRFCGYEFIGRASVGDPEAPVAVVTQSIPPQPATRDSDQMDVSAREIRRRHTY